MSINVPFLYVIIPYAGLSGEDAVEEVSLTRLHISISSL